MIINELALIANNFLINLFNAGIKFSDILVGLFIFNFVVYVITYMIKHFE
jgi:hypothetical protein